MMSKTLNMVGVQEWKCRIIRMHSNLRDHQLKIIIYRDFPAVQWLGLSVSTAGGMGSIPGKGTKIPQATQHGQKEIIYILHNICYN